MRRQRTQRPLWRLSSHKGALLMQTALRSTVNGCATVAEQDDMWSECAILARAAAAAYDALVRDIRREELSAT